MPTRCGTTQNPTLPIYINSTSPANSPMSIGICLQVHQETHGSGIPESDCCETGNRKIGGGPPCTTERGVARSYDLLQRNMAIVMLEAEPPCTTERGVARSYDLVVATVPVTKYGNPRIRSSYHATEGIGYTYCSICDPSVQNQSHVAENINRVFHMCRKRRRWALIWCKKHLFVTIS